MSKINGTSEAGKVGPLARWKGIDGRVHRTAVVICHQLTTPVGKKTAAKCGASLPPKPFEKGAVSGWHSDITCSACLAKPAQ